MMGAGSTPPWLRRAGIEVLGWLLVAAGLAALVLPGPGLLALMGGLLVLSLQYSWAKRLLVPVKAKALRMAVKGVRTWPRILASITGGTMVIAAGLLWGLRPPKPGWWAIGDQWWLPGGWGTGSVLIASGLIALALITYSYRRFRRPPNLAKVTGSGTAPPKGKDMTAKGTNEP
ncbi:DUF4175 domain-containing protein [Arthrobacter mobilis]|uniref:DUF4175 domain-containing protein n=1 Tax=Arthrobacter mobilis TaxID=2724944 RepID=A0A7X6K569_9MICC|nr:DUF4175 domain-containing protein [Arthrobacter mobilis]NKX55390.1 DUF4175 domain-containing protein [Arthrobacter mobilis]